MKAARFVAGAAIVSAWVAWWAPTIGLGLARLLGLQAFHLVETVVVDLLFACRRDQAARRVLAWSIRRNRRHLRAAQRRARRAEP